MKIAAAAVLLALAAGSSGLVAQAQTYVPGQAQARINQEQLQIQSNQLQQLQQQNAAGLSRPGAAGQLHAIQRQHDIQQQIDQSDALRQQMNAPDASPGNVGAQLQAGQARIDQLQLRQPSVR